jgi:hypothetical protein
MPFLNEKHISRILQEIVFRVLEQSLSKGRILMPPVLEEGEYYGSDVVVDKESPRYAK